MTKMYVSNEAFVQAILNAHKNGDKMSDVASRLGLEVVTCKSRANKLRKLGVSLPKLKSARQQVDVATLAKMVSDYEAASAASETEENSVVNE